MKFVSHNPEETEKIAYNFAQTLNGGEVITLDGDLGAGKTAFVRGLARGLGISDRISSPTFTIVNEYRNGDIPLFHFDVYRISYEDEMYDIGWDDYVARGAVIVVEWASNVPGIFDADTIRIEISKDIAISEDYRTIEIKGKE